MDLNKNADGFRMVPEAISNGLLYGAIIFIVIGVGWYLYERM
ncbi:hypothetical protein [Peribacillus sp. TH16]|nr:hypothetical protein [Peribacillus sp. TH16]